MNKKGYTLVEVIVSVMILGIAGTILATSFTTVINYMSRSNSVKNASDELYSYIEGSDDVKTSNSVNTVDSASVSYTINSKIKVSGTLTTLDSEKSDEIYLSSLSVEGRNLLGDEIFYKEMIKKSDKIYKLISENINSLCLSKDQICDVFGQKEMVKYFYEKFYNEGLDVFDNKLLPNKEKEKKYYVSVYFPFDTSNERDVVFGSPIIYLSENHLGFNNKEETVKFVYDYNSSKWYYNDSTTKLYSIVSLIAGTGLPNVGMSNLKVKINGQSSAYILSFDQLLKDIKTENSEWKVLNESQKYTNSTISDNFWTKAGE